MGEYHSLGPGPEHNDTMIAALTRDEKYIEYKVTYGDGAEWFVSLYARDTNSGMRKVLERVGNRKELSKIELSIR